MSALVFEDLLQALPSLTQKQLSELVARAGFLRQHAAPELANSDTDETLSCLIEAARSLGAEFTPESVLRKSPRYAQFKQKAEGLHGFFAMPTRNQRRRLLITAYKLLADDLTRMGLPVTARLLMQHTHRLPAVVNRSYPGYAANRLLHMIVPN